LLKLPQILWLVVGFIVVQEEAKANAQRLN